MVTQNFQFSVFNFQSMHQLLNESNLRKLERCQPKADPPQAEKFNENCKLKIENFVLYYTKLINERR